MRELRRKVMGSNNYDDPEVLEHWRSGQRVLIENYLLSQGVEHGRIGDRPAWDVAPYVSIWAIESLARPAWIGWWVISGDLPTDYISSADLDPPQHPRKAVHAIAVRFGPTEPGALLLKCEKSLPPNRPFKLNRIIANRLCAKSMFLADEHTPSSSTEFKQENLCATLCLPVLCVTPW
jgi:hypothetical protein